MPYNFLVIGLGTFGRQAAVALASGGAEVLAVDHSEERVNGIRDQVSRAVCCDTLDEEAMSSIGAFDVDCAIVAIRRHFDVTVLATHALHKKGVPRILAQVESDNEAEAIRAVGSTETIFPQRDMALRIANKLLHPNLADHIPLGCGAALIDIPCPPPFAGHTLGGLALRTRYGVTLIGLRPAPVHGAPTPSDPMQLNPPPETRLRADDHLLLLGTLTELEHVQALTHPTPDTETPFWS
ncbi:MAG: TrkA family potassium uptake protein [Magnetococcales bacterium]|nr:TrkA family potassium uptake protein [Magnetococcales bacterium]